MRVQLTRVSQGQRSVAEASPFLLALCMLNDPIQGTSSPSQLAAVIENELNKEGISDGDFISIYYFSLHFLM